MGIIIGLLLFIVLFGIGVKLTGALVLALVWLCIRLPLTLVFLALGLVFCCTIILIPIGLAFWKAGVQMLIP